ncbi:MAG TPA: YhbY family RNA-binding protein [Deltaproteobacteria bacterium]|nr:YhbY family RNA-binding protein [Deltaproteobacteria bacterium]
MPLTLCQQRHLRALAHNLDPSVRVGAAGVTDGVIQAIEEALIARELIKVRLDADRGGRLELAGALTERTGAEVAQIIGRIVVLYRRAPDPARRRISAPG